MSAQCPTDRQLCCHRVRRQSPLLEPGLACCAAPNTTTFWARQFAVEATVLWGRELTVQNEQDSWRFMGVPWETTWLSFSAPWGLLILGGMTAFFANVQF